MAYQNSWYGASPYVPGYNPQPSYTPVYQQPRQLRIFDWVQGEAAAGLYQVDPGATVVLMDTEQPILYMKSADQTGKPYQMEVRYLVSKEEYESLQNGSKHTNYVTKEELDSALDKLNDKFVRRKENKNG